MQDGGKQAEAVLCQNYNRVLAQFLSLLLSVDAEQERAFLTQLLS